MAATPRSETTGSMPPAASAGPPVDGRAPSGDVLPYAPVDRRAPLGDILTYAAGDGAASLVMNSFSAFLMLYYTKALGIDVRLAGVGMVLVTIWDAITDPIMGHITDNTRSRYGRRHPYMLVGGAVTVLCFYAAWAVPDVFRSPSLAFWYLLAVTMLLRTAATVFLVAHAALGFEICTEYSERSKLQGIRIGMNMVVNLAMSLTAWNIFLRSRGGVEGTSIPENYERLGLVFAIVALVFIAIAVFGTRKYIVDTRKSATIGDNSLRSVVRNLAQILRDPYPRWIFAFLAVLYVGIILTCQIQMFVYVDFMLFSDFQKSIVHGSTIVAAVIGSLIAAPLVRRLDKKPAVYLGVVAGSLSNFMLVALFYTGWVSPGAAWKTVPIAMLLFLVFNSGYHLATNVVKVVTYSMMADVSEIGRYRTGVLKDGGYSAMMLFVVKLGMSLGVLAAGWLMPLVGYTPSSETNSPEAIRNLLPLGFFGGGAIGLLALLAIVRYPVDRAAMREVKAALARRSETNEA